MRIYRNLDRLAGDIGHEVITKPSWHHTALVDFIKIVAQDMVNTTLESAVMRVGSLMIFSKPASESLTRYDLEVLDLVTDSSNVQMFMSPRM